MYPVESLFAVIIYPTLGRIINKSIGSKKITDRCTDIPYKRQLISFIQLQLVPKRNLNEMITIGKGFLLRPDLSCYSIIICKSRTLRKTRTKVNACILRSYFNMI